MSNDTQDATVAHEDVPPCPTWEELRAVVAKRVQLGELYAVGRYINTWPERLRPAVALALSVAHWSREARTGYDDYGRRERLGFPRGFYDCGLCALYHLRENTCTGCPLYKAVGVKCQDRESLYHPIDYSLNRHEPGFHKAADALYNKLIELYAAEWEKL